MKIFAKRGSGISSGSAKKTTKPKQKSSTEQEPRTIFQSDPIVQALLEKDPSTWNSKERRLVKRYRGRNIQPEEQQQQQNEDENGKEKAAIEVDENPVTANDDKSDNENIKKKEDKEKEKEDAAEANQNPASSSDMEDSSSSDSSEDDSEDDDENKDKEKEENKDEDDGKNDEKESHNNTEMLGAQTDGDAKEEKKAYGDDNDDNDDATRVVKDHEIWALLNQLNSKQKRTLSRKLDRMGPSVLEEVREEATKLLDGGDKQSANAADGTPASDATKKRPLQDSAASTPTSGPDTSTPSSPKKKKKTTDWSHLPTEERLRREEQRRKQQEAAERRECGEDLTSGSHKHPLNSQRRRANRRKPKWKKPTSFKVAVKNEHNSSGYLMRRQGEGAGQGGGGGVDC